MKKLLALFLVSALSLSLLAGCGDEDPDVENAEGGVWEGTYYLNGDPDGESITISGSEYEIATEFGEDSGTWEYGPTTLMLSNGEQMEIAPDIQTEFPDPTLSPAMGGMVLYAKDTFDYKFYIHESCLEDSIADGTPLMNTMWENQIDEDTVLVIQFSPQYFQIFTYTIDENGTLQPNQDGDSYGGTWELDSDNTLTMTYTDGTSDSQDFYGDTQQILSHVAEGMFISNDWF